MASIEADAVTLAVSSSDLGHCFGLDIGGSLTKIVYFEKRESSDQRKRRPRASSYDVAAAEMTSFLLENELFGQTGVQDVRLRVHSKTLQGVSQIPVLESELGNLPVHP